MIMLLLGRFLSCFSLPYVVFIRGLPIVRAKVVGYKQSDMVLETGIVILLAGRGADLEFVSRILLVVSTPFL